MREQRSSLQEIVESTAENLPISFVLNSKTSEFPKGAINEVRGFEAALDVDNRSSINLRIFTFLRANYFYLNLFTFSKLY